MFLSKIYFKYFPKVKLNKCRTKRNSLSYATPNRNQIGQNIFKVNLHHFYGHSQENWIYVQDMPDLYSKLLFLYQRRFCCYLTNSSSNSLTVFYFLLFSNQLKILDLLFGWLICSATTFSYNTELHNSINDTQSYFSFLLLFLLLWLFKEIKKNIGQGYAENFRVKKKTALHFLNNIFIQ